MSAARTLRTLRQKRLREVGEAGQQRLFEAHAHVSDAGLRGEFAVRYLVGAGVMHVSAPSALHATARALDPEVALTDETGSTTDAVVPDVIVDPAARAAFAGALDALGFVRRCLALGESP